MKNLVPHDEDIHKDKDVHTTNLSSTNFKPKVLLTKSTQVGDKQLVELVLNKQKYSFKMALAGTFNAYNAVAAFLTALLLDINPKLASTSLAGVKFAFGRGELIEINGKKVRLLLVKNPSGYNQIIKTFLLDHPKLHILMALNDNFADGRDVSWVWM